MNVTTEHLDELPSLQAFLDKASAIELARRSLIGAPVYSIISLIMVFGTPFLRENTWLVITEAVSLVLLGAVRMLFALGFARHYERVGERAVIQFSILTAIQSLALGVLAGIVIWQYWATQIKQRRMAVEDEARRSFLADIGYEIRTPASSIVGLTALLQDEPLDKRTRSFVDMIRHSSEALLKLVEDIPGSMKSRRNIKPSKLEPIKLRQCVQSAVDLYTRKRAIRSVSTWTKHRFPCCSEISPTSSRCWPTC